ANGLPGPPALPGRKRPCTSRPTFSWGTPNGLMWGEWLTGLVALFTVAAGTAPIIPQTARTGEGRIPDREGQAGTFLRQRLCPWLRLVPLALARHNDDSEAVPGFCVQAKVTGNTGRGPPRR